MAKGDVHQSSFVDFRDPVSDTRVTRLMPGGAASLRSYFYQKCFSSDGQSLLLGSDLGGALNFWLLDLRTARARQLTEGEGDNIQGAYLSPDDRRLYFTRGGRQHIELDLETLQERVAYAVPPGWTGYSTWAPNAGCTKVIGLEMWAADRVTGAQGWERFARQYHAKPRMRLIEIDIASGLARTVWEEGRYLGHPMYRPFDDQFLGFCHEGPHDLVDTRVWFINADGSQLRPFKHQGPDEYCTHEFWVPDGSRLIYVSYRKGETRRAIWSVDPLTLRNECLMAMPPCAHLMSNQDGSLLVGDGATQAGDVEARESVVDDPHIYLFDLARQGWRVVCRHDSSSAVWHGNTQANHPHPSFTPDQRRVLFASDRDGPPGLYLADLPR